MATSLGNPSHLTISTETHGGEFPFLVRIVQPAADKAPTIEQLRDISRRLNAIMLTDDVAVGPLFDDGYTLIGPDGTTPVVHTNEEGPDGADIVLYPESRALPRPRIQAVAHGRQLATIFTPPVSKVRFARRRHART